MKKKDNTVRMSYSTYDYLRGLLNIEMERLQTDFQKSTRFIPTEPFKRGVDSGLDKAHKIFSAEYAKLQAMETELHDVAQSTYKNHPNPEMRKFWGLKD